MGLKSFAPLTIAAIGVITLLALFLIPLISILTLKYHLIEKIELSYKYNSADLALLNLLNYKKKFVINDPGAIAYEKIMPIYKILSENHLSNFGGFISDYTGIWKIRYAIPIEIAKNGLNQTLANLTFSECYKLLLDSNSFIQTGNCEIKHSTCFDIFLPYPEKTKRVCLELSS